MVAPLSRTRDVTPRGEVAGGEPRSKACSPIRAGARGGFQTRWQGVRFLTRLPMTEGIAE